MAVPEARDSRGGDDQPCPRVVVTIPGGDEDLARAARSICRLVSDGSLTTDRQGNAALTMAPATWSAWRASSPPSTRPSPIRTVTGTWTTRAGPTTRQPGTSPTTSETPSRSLTSCWPTLT